MICKGCNQDRPLIKSHVIPESFFTGHRIENKSPVLMSDSISTYPKKSPIGVYDKEILCEECENKFQEVDDYGYSLLLKNESSHIELKQSNSVIGYQINDVNYKLLKLFFVSVLWRASISTQDFYSKVQLGRYESIAKDIIWSGCLDGTSVFNFVVTKFKDPQINRQMFDPDRKKFFGINYYLFYMYGYVIYIKVDKLPTPDEFKLFELNADGVLSVCSRDILKSDEFEIMRSILNNEKNKKVL